MGAAAKIDRSLKMRPIDRVDAAFAGKPTDRVPVAHIQFASRMAALVLGREAYVGGGIQQYREACALWKSPDAHAEFVARSLKDAVDLAVATEQDLVRPSHWRMNVKPVRRIDAHTFMYGNPDGEYHINRFFPETEMYQTIEEYPPKPEVTLEDLEKQVNALEKSVADYQPRESIFEDPLKAREVLKGERALRCGGVWLCIPYEPAVWLEATILKPELVARYLDVDVVKSCKNAELAGKLGLKYLFGGGDFATNTGPLYSPKVFHELMLPRLKKISDACHRNGVKHLFGSDGNSWLVSDDLFGASGVDGYYEVDRLAGMDLRKLRARFPNLTLIGNVSSQTLHTATKQQVIDETLDVIETAKELGHILVGCSNQVIAETPPENMFAMLETIRNNR
jgi:hypothetical protein